MLQVNLFGIIVDEMKRSLDFYRQLGVDIPDGMDSERHVEITLPGGMRLAWDTVEIIRSFDPSWTAAARGGRIEIAFSCESPAEVDTVYQTLSDLGDYGHLAPFDAPWGQRYAMLHDPDGNGIALFASK